MNRWRVVQAVVVAIVVSGGVWALTWAQDRPPSPRPPGDPARLPLPAAQAAGQAQAAEQAQPAGTTKPAAEETAGPATAAKAAGDSATAALAMEEPLLARAEEFVAAYNAHDVEKLVDLFTPDADIERVDGTKLVGHEELWQSFREAFTDNPQARVSLEIDAIRFVTADVAIEHGQTIFFADGEHPTAASAYEIVHVKRDRVWRMAQARTLREEVLTAADHLSQLEFLVGDWLDESDEATVSIQCRWDESGNYLLEDYSVVRHGAIVVQGTNRIAWDPQAKSVRSWAFDTAGGFAEGHWTPADPHWVVKSRGVLPDGGNASMTRTIVPVSADMIRCTLSERITDGELLPDVTFTLVRVAEPPGETARPAPAAKPATPVKKAP